MVVLCVVVLVPALLLMVFGALVAAVVVLPFELFNSLENFERVP